MISSAELPKFKDAGLINAAGTPIKYWCPAPWVGDWNGDGKKDLIIGVFIKNSPNVFLYLNIGTNSAPEFAAKQNLKAGGQDIYLHSG